MDGASVTPSGDSLDITAFALLTPPPFLPFVHSLSSVSEHHVHFPSSVLTVSLCLGNSLALRLLESEKQAPLPSQSQHNHQAPESRALPPETKELHS